MADEGCYATHLALLADPAFRALLKRSRDDHLPWPEFLEMKLPSCMSPRETWRVLQEFRRAEAIEFPMPRDTDEKYWYTRTNRINKALSVIDRSCASDSYLHRKVSDTSGRQFLVRSRMAEASAAAQMDGLSLTKESVTKLLLLDHAPRTAAERLLVNTMTAMAKLPDYVHAEFSPGLMMELRSLLLDGVDPSLVEATEPALGLLGEHELEYEKGLSAEQKGRYICEYICEYANGVSGETREHNTIRAIILMDMMRVCLPLPDTNSQVGRLMFRLYALKNGLPVLGMLPITKATVLWEHNEAPYADLSVNHELFQAERKREPNDSTLYVTLYLEMILRELAHLAETVHRAEARDEEMLGMLRGEARINARQRRVLARAMRDPDAEFRIGFHKTNHEITYATARRDLVGLAEAGYLVCNPRGRRQVFTPAPDLPAKLGTTEEDMLDDE